MKNKGLIYLIKQTKPSKAIIAFSIIIALIGAIASLILPLLTRDIIDGTLANFSWQQAGFILFVFIIQATMNGLTFYMLSYLGEKIVMRLRELLWNKIIYLPISYFSNSMSGETISRMINDTNILKELVSERIINFITGIFTLVTSVIILFILDWQMTLFMIIAIPLTALVVIPLGKMIYKISLKTQDKTAALTSDLSQSLSEMKLVKASNAENIEDKKTRKSVFDLFTFGIKEAKIGAILYPLISGIVLAVIFIIIAYGGLRVSSGTLTSGTLIAFILYLFQIIGPITDFGTFITQFQKAKGATTRILEIMEEDSEKIDDGVDYDIANKVIEFKNVSFSYNEDNETLNNMSFKAYPNETIAFVGPSGGGKSTTFALLERFYLPNEGSIEIEGMNINDIKISSWRSQIGYVFQESSLFATTIRENLCYGLNREVSDDELDEVMQLAYASEIIEKLEKGYDTKVGERGLKLSGGERQRIAIARAFLRDPKILLLDEATSSLDSQSEMVVQEALENLMKNRTTFVIAHRLATIVNADQIVFIDDGKITGIGKHQELIKSHEMYASFAKAQLTD